MDPYNVKVGPPVIPFEDHRDYWAVFDVQVRQDDDGNYVATIEAGGKTFEARHFSRTQAVHDVEQAVKSARDRHEIFPGVF